MNVSQQSFQGSPTAYTNNGVGFVPEIWFPKQLLQVFLSRQLVDWAIEHGASVIVFENLKGWRPKGGNKGSNLRQRFHGWLHRLLVNLTEEKFAEVGGKTEFVFARGTSSWAFVSEACAKRVGSGKVKRNQKNYSLATFSTGKQYNADLSASYNIGARYWASKNKKLAFEKSQRVCFGQKFTPERARSGTLRSVRESGGTPARDRPPARDWLTPVASTEDTSARRWLPDRTENAGIPLDLVAHTASGVE